MITLLRVSSSRTETFGVLLDDKKPLCVTLEDPWNHNKVGVSCIPTGKYKCTPHNGAKYKNVWILNDVPSRSAILIHAGNTAEETRGCILVGSGFGVNSITRSRDALNYLRKTLPDEFELQIREFHEPLPWWRRLFY